MHVEHNNNFIAQLIISMQREGKQNIYYPLHERVSGFDNKSRQKQPLLN